MKMATVRADKRRSTALPGLHGVVRLDRRAPRLLSRLHPGDVAVLDLDDLDRSTADALVAARVGAVINAQPSISGRYPTLGPAVLVSQNVPLLDAVGTEVFAAVKEGTRVRLAGAQLFVGDQLVATGVRQDSESVAQSLAAARAGLSAQLEAFGASTREHMQAERELLLDGVGLPALRTSFAGRHVLLVSRGYDFQNDLKSLKHYIREFRPVLVGIDGGGDVLRDAGYRPDLLVGETEAMSDPVLQQAGEVVSHADRHGRAKGLSRVQDLRIEPVIFATSGSSEDAAMLLADAGTPTLIVTVGIRATLEEFFDAGRGAIASTVLTRLKVGGKLVDAKAAAQLFQTRISVLSLLLLAVAAALATGVVVLVTQDAGDNYWTLVAHGWSTGYNWLKGLFS